VKPSLFRSLPAALVAAFLLWPALLSADVVELRGGLVGKITRIDGGSVVLATDFAGMVTLQQAEVISITTDAPVAVRFANGTRVDGVVSSPGAGRVRVANAEGEFTSDVAKVAASWAAGGKDPPPPPWSAAGPSRLAPTLTAKAATGTRSAAPPVCARPSMAPPTRSSSSPRMTAG